MARRRPRFGPRTSPLRRGLALLLAPSSQAATFVVDTINDGGDINLGDGICRQTGPPPRCSLRAALEEANALAGADTINFGIGAVGSSQMNGFFHFPPLNSLAEQFVKAEGKGAVAAFSPSGLSLDAPAHVFHKALLTELLSDRHQRLGDAVLAAQGTYAESGAFPELLSIYNLFGDPAMKVR